MLVFFLRNWHIKLFLSTCCHVLGLVPTGFRFIWEPVETNICTWRMSLMLSSHIVLGLPRIIFRFYLGLATTTWTCCCVSRSVYTLQNWLLGACHAVGGLQHTLICLICYLHDIFNIHRKPLISNACSLRYVSAFRFSFHICGIVWTAQGSLEQFDLSWCGHVVGFPYQR